MIWFVLSLKQFHIVFIISFYIRYHYLLYSHVLYFRFLTHFSYFLKFICLLAQFLYLINTYLSLHISVSSTTVIYFPSGWLPCLTSVHYQGNSYPRRLSCMSVQWEVYKEQLQHFPMVMREQLSITNKFFFSKHLTHPIYILIRHISHILCIF